MYINTNFVNLVLISYFRLVLGNITLLEQAKLIQSIAGHLNCDSIILVEGFSDSIRKIFFLEKYLSNNVRFYVGVWKFKTFTRNIYSDEVWIPPKSLVVMEYNSFNVKELSKISSRTDLALFNWLIITTLPLISDTSFENIRIPINCRFIISTVNTNNVFDIHEVYRISRNSDIIMKPFGAWNLENGLHDLNGVDMLKLRMDLKGYEFKFAVHNISNDINPCSNTKVDNGKQVIQCAYFNVWKDIERLLNFTTTYVVIEDCYLNGTAGLSTPVLEAIQNGEVDTGNDGYVWSPSRLVHNKFLWPLFFSKVILATKVPPRKFSFSSYVHPFESKMWFALIAWLIFSGLIVNFSKYIANRIFFKNQVLLKNDIIENFFMPFTAICYQGSSTVPVETTVRLAYLMVYLIPVVFIPSYSGSIISSLSISPENFPFTSIQEFEADGSYNLNAVNNTFFQFYLMTDEKFEGVRKKHLISKQLSVSYQEGVKDICSKRETFIFEWPVLTRYSVTCNVFKFDVTATKVFTSMAVRKNFPYLELFNRQIQKLAIAGFGGKMLKKITSYYFEYELRPFPQSNFQLRPFSFEEVLPVFAVLAAGFLLSIILLIFERHHELFSTQVRKFLMMSRHFLKRSW